MSELPEYHGKHYAEGRPTYPEDLFQFIGSKTPSHDLAWDAGTGTGQAARSVSPFFPFSSVILLHFILFYFLNIINSRRKYKLIPLR